MARRGRSRSSPSSPSASASAAAGRGIIPPLLLALFLASSSSSSSSSFSVLAQTDGGLGDGGGPKASLPPSASSTPRSARPVRFASPLRSFTVMDKAPSSSSSSSSTTTASASTASPRRRFLPKFRAGLAAERSAREAIAEELRASLLEEEVEEEDDYSRGGREWAEMEAAKEELRRAADEVRVERAYDRAVARFDDADRTGKKTKKSSDKSSAAAAAEGGSQYQFVGVVNPPGQASGGSESESESDGKKKEEPPVTWYARRKPPNAKWSVRLVHVDRDAVVRDMFASGKVDVFGEYVNTGKTDKAAVAAGAAEGGTGKEETTTDNNVPALEARYTVRERSWRNLWNFSPLRVLSDSSGMYWRERRLRPGLYTDGRTVYEAAYDYADGRNGMRPLSSLDAYLASGGVRGDDKEEVLRRLREDGPDVVVED